jgi:hypothetical protein
MRADRPSQHAQDHGELAPGADGEHRRELEAVALKDTPQRCPDVQLKPDDDEERFDRHCVMGGEEPEPASSGERPGAVAAATTDEQPAAAPRPDSLTRAPPRR